MFTLIALLPSALTLASIATYAIKRALTHDWQHEAYKLAMGDEQ